MLFAPLTSLEIPNLIPKEIDGFEARLDFLRIIELDQVKDFLAKSPIPVLLTLRKASQGGNFRGSELDRERIIEELLKLSPAFFDLEGEMRPNFIREMIKRHPNTRFILSHHDFEKTPKNLETIFEQLAQYKPFTCKIAAKTESAIDALRMLFFTKMNPIASAICMGEKGKFARVLGKVFGNLVDYAILSDKNEGQAASTPTAPGQLELDELTEIYRYPSLNIHSRIYGLIGNPIEKSPGHLYHNGVFREKNINAVYVKMTVNPEELPEFLSLSKKLGIHGLSVTIPLKEVILPLIDEIEPTARKIGAVNTLALKNDKIYGFNTDGAGALDAIESTILVKNKRLIILGAGGAARAIAFEATIRGADVTILNRTKSKAQNLAKTIGAKSGGLDEVPCDAEIIVNCAPNEMPINPSLIPSQSYAMDISVASGDTKFIEEAKSRNCRIINGKKMFLNQADGQTKIWLEAIKSYQQP